MLYDTHQNDKLIIWIPGLYARLDQEYYLAKDNGPVMMECQLGVGADGSAPAQTSWYVLAGNKLVYMC